MAGRQIFSCLHAKVVFPCVLFFKIFFVLVNFHVGIVWSKFFCLPLDDAARLYSVLRYWPLSGQGTFFCYLS